MLFSLVLVDGAVCLKDVIQQSCLGASPSVGVVCLVWFGLVHRWAVVGCTASWCGEMSRCVNHTFDVGRVYEA